MQKWLKNIVYEIIENDTTLLQMTEALLENGIIVENSERGIGSRGRTVKYSSFM